MNWHVNYLSLATVILLVGCQQEPETPAEPEVPEAGDAVSPIDSEHDIETELGAPTPAPAGQVEEPTTSSAETTSAEAVTLDIKSWEETQQIVKQAEGKIVVMDLWATYCAPCLVELPNLVELHKKHGDDVKCLSVSLDYQGFEDQPVKSYVEPVLGVLKPMGATFQNVLLSTESDVIYQEKIEQGSIPVVLVYGRDGKLAGQFPDPDDPAEFTYQEDVIPLVEKLLNAK